MIIYPAIDLYEGKAVRLKRGDYAQMTVYSDDPLTVAKGFKKTGASALHVVDLQGARDGKPENYDVIKRIANEAELFVQVGGGLRTAEVIEETLNAGVNRVILGTAAVLRPGFLEEMVEKHGESIGVSADIKDGFVAIKGWTEVSKLNALEFCDTVADQGVRTLICTDISKDGMLTGTNIELYQTLRSRLQIGLIASGGVTSIDEIKKLSEIGINGVILGKALYTGDIDLAEAIGVEECRKKG